MELSALVVVLSLPIVFRLKYMLALFLMVYGYCITVMCDLAFDLITYFSVRNLTILTI